MSRLGTLGLLGLAAAAIAAGAYQLGSKHTDNAWRARQLDVERAANATRVRNVELGIEAVAQANTDKQDQEKRYADLEERYAELRQRIPLVVAPAKRAPRPILNDTAAATGGPGAATLGEAQEREPDPPVHELSGAAVWMWNSALAGHPDVPPDSCGAAGAGRAAGAACAEGTGLTVEEDAWPNQADNAQRAKRNLDRYERLRAFLLKRQADMKNEQ